MRLLLRVLGSILAAIFMFVGLYFIGTYVVTVLTLYLNDEPDKSMVYWGLAFLLIGVPSCTVSLALILLVRGRPDRKSDCQRPNNLE